ncbi:uncharacterized protein LOC115878524 [Sitophilus oryzae]|uniref:Uncharacterized protein LOC115878524 n=1 Tax=Sitophilus oryzae TaxID=7048 RepID=A0A6J2XHY6_SITOR|nr:uncharacterized protein LOC115878524 [Sitophilus oryzae]
MGRVYKKKLGARPYRNYTEELLLRAVNAVKTTGISYQAAADLYDIPKRTIYNRAKNKHNKLFGGQTSLSETEEREIVDVLLISAEFGSPLTSFDLRVIVKRYLDRLGRTIIKFPNNLPGKDWCLNFLSRHKNRLSQRACQNIKGVRAQNTEQQFLEYFENLTNSLNGIPKENILNYDETNLSDDPGSKKCIFRRGIKYPERLMNSTKSCISVMFAITGGGEVLPPYVVYKAERLYDQWTIGGPKKARYNRSKSGWFDGFTFQDWFYTMVLPWSKSKKGSKAIIGDNLSSHLDHNIIVECQRNDIKFVFLPPNSTHLTQPLDVAYYGPMKRVWRDILQKYKLKNPRETSLNKVSFPPLLKSLVERLENTNKTNIESAFRATGIIPLNPHEVLKRLPGSRTNEHIIGKTVNETLIAYLEEIRAPTAGTSNERKRKKMLKVTPGKSVCADELFTETINVNEDPQDFDDLEIMRCEHDNSIEEAIMLEEDYVGVGGMTEEDNIENILKNIPKIGDYVVVKFLTKKTVKHYLAEVINVDRPEL